MRNLSTLAIGILMMLATMSARAVDVQVRPDAIRGRVFDAASNRGIEGLSVQLVAPKVMKQPVRLTITTADGAFAFTDLKPGKYLLSISRGSTLLYRKEIDNHVADRFEVPLRTVPDAR